MRNKIEIPIIRRERLAAGGLISNVIGKETIKLNVKVDPETITALYTVAGIVTTGILIHAVVRTFK